jgi:hypothetical protein
MLSFLPSVCRRGAEWFALAALPARATTPGLSNLAIRRNCEVRSKFPLKSPSQVLPPNPAVDADRRRARPRNAIDGAQMRKGDGRPRTQSAGATSSMNRRSCPRWSQDGKRIVSVSTPAARKSRIRCTTSSTGSRASGMSPERISACRTRTPASEHDHDSRYGLKHRAGSECPARNVEAPADPHYGSGAHRICAAMERGAAARAQRGGLSGIRTLRSSGSVRCCRGPGPCLWTNAPFCEKLP